MKRILFFLFSLIFISVSYAQRPVVYIGNIDSEIDLGLAPYVKRVVDEAEKNHASAIIFHINTFGGRVDAATQIKDAILNSKVRTIAFVDKRAISAGALIALSCEKIVMAPGSSLGASTVVDQSGQKQSEKYQSYMRSEMRATAEKNHRRSDIAQAMVDESIVVPDLNDDATKLVTLTYEEAVKYKMADTVLSSIADIENAFGYKGAQDVTVGSNWAEDFVSFLNNPIVSSILIIIGLVGIFMEIKMGVWGLPGTVAVIALALFFGSSYILQLASVIDIVMFVVGVILLLIEIFVIPGFGIAGVLGILLMIFGLFLSLVSDFQMRDFSFLSMAIIQLASVFVATGVFIFLLSKILPKTNVWNRLILHENIGGKSGYASKPTLEHLVGAEGVALTDLRPAGAAIIDGNRIDVVTEGDYISHDAAIVVKSVEGSKVVVGMKS
ncbi:MAG: ATP-dependent Clp protease proteolytic subunit [Bacteroidetes bacterium]|nr:ATP-dependent Clp protease proteolytic subunit [Bacteroidota bacterium]